MSIKNIQPFNPFVAEAINGLESRGVSSQTLNLFEDDPISFMETDSFTEGELVQIRIHQHSRYKLFTTVQGLSAKYDLQKIVLACEREFASNWTVQVVDHVEYGKVLWLPGDQRKIISQFLVQCDLVKIEQIIDHGFTLLNHTKRRKSYMHNF